MNTSVRSSLALLINGHTLGSSSRSATVPTRSRSRAQCICLLALLLIGVAGSCRAADILWVGSSGNWNVPGNWSPNQVPGPGDNALITSNGTYTVTLNANITNASLTLGGASGTQTLSIGSFMLNLTNASVVNPHGVLAVAGGTFTNSSSTDVSGLLNWSGGTIGGGTVTVKPGATVTVAGGTGKTLAAANLINGSAFALGDLISFNGSATISNAANGTITATGAGSGTSGSGLLVNDGQLNVAVGGASLAQLAAGFTNNGTVSVQSGTLRLASTSSTTTGNGSFSLALGATLLIFTGTHELAPGSSVTGAGNFTVSGGTANLRGGFSITGTNTFTAGTANFLGNYSLQGNILNISGGGTANFMPGGTIAPGLLNMSAGTLGASNTVSVDGLTSWSGGTIQGNADVKAMGPLTISGGTGKVLTGSRLINSSSATWNGAQVTMNGAAVLSNALSGIIQITGATSSGGGVIANAGSFIVAPGPAIVASLNSFFTNYGTVEVQSGTLTLPGGGLSAYSQAAGLTLLDGGTINNAVPLRILSGMLAGTNSITGSVINSGTLSPGSSPGKLTIGGTCTQTPSSALNIELRGTTQGIDFDLLAVTGAATLSGVLNVSLINGFLPSPGDNYQILKFGSRSGTFPSVTGLHCPNGIVLVPRYTATDLSLLAANEPLLSSPTNVGNEFHFDVLTTAGFNYQAEYADSLDAPIQWTPFNVPFAGTDAKVTVIQNPSTVPQRFFRVQIY